MSEREEFSPSLISVSHHCPLFDFRQSWAVQDKSSTLLHSRLQCEAKWMLLVVLLSQLSTVGNMKGCTEIEGIRSEGRRGRESKLESGVDLCISSEFPSLIFVSLELCKTNHQFCSILVFNVKRSGCFLWFC